MHLTTLLHLLLLLPVAWAFAPVSVPHVVAPSSSRYSSSSPTDTADDVLNLSLTKPLGVVLEENVEGAASGVYVRDVGDAGSAAPHADVLRGAALRTVMGVDVTEAAFDAVMEVMGDAPETVDLTFVPKTTFDVGTVVTVTAERGDGQEDLVFEAKVGDNLRQALLDNGFEVYQGMKQKLGNCGGGGTCTFCAMDFIESEGWEDRVDYENQKLAKNPQARLACLNPIQGPVKLRKAER